MSKVVVVAHDYVRRAMAGPAIRCMELSRQLHRAGHEVTLAVPHSTDLDPEPYRLVPYDTQDRSAIPRLVEHADVVVIQGWVLEHNPSIREISRTLVVDLYDPFPLEYLASVADDPTGSFPTWDDVLGTLVEQVRLGDFFICASERQRDLWIGFLLALNRVSLANYMNDPTLRNLLDVVPFGVPGEAPVRTGPGLRGTLGVGPEDVVLLWGGGIYNWFDPLTLIRAVAQVHRRHPRVRLVFLSASHPNPDIPAMAMLARARELARDLGIEGSAVIFNDAWVPYAERASWLLDADVGVSTHLDHAETRFSFRTRILDYFWAGLPMICTVGDSLADLIEEHGLGFTVPAGDVAGTAAAIETLVADPVGRRERSARVRELATGLTWDRAAAPLLRFCADPRPAPDRVLLPAGSAPRLPVRSDAERRHRRESPSRSLLGRTARKLRSEGPLGLARAAARRLRSEN